MDYLEQRSTPNYTSGRQNSQIEAVVLHSTEGEFPGLNDWLTNKKSKVSYHVVISKAGEFFQYVEFKNTAWHAGVVYKSDWPFLDFGDNPNLYTVGLAYEGYAQEGPSPIQYFYLAFLTAFLSINFDFQIDKNTVIGHNKIRTDKNCPGAKFPISSFIDLALIFYRSM